MHASNAVVRQFAQRNAETELTAQQPSTNIALLGFGSPLRTDNTLDIHCVAVQTSQKEGRSRALLPKRALQP